ncbi:hypothetical protein [Erwinia pyrifoliae]|uniref:Uncharacterized protein n=1 Tax=Erwinia pyrifoliae TaxID=79967 RepID=A0ABY5X8I3_ERWPY
MEQLQRLAEVIAGTYLEGLIRDSGSDRVEHNGVSGKVSSPLLASGLIDNVISAARDLCIAEDYQREAYKMLMEMISFDGPQYQLTQHGRAVIDTMNSLALAKKCKLPTH